MNQITAILIDATAKATILLAIACLALRLLRNRSAAARHLLLTFSLCAALLLPAITLLAPAWHVQGIPQIAANTEVKDVPAATMWQSHNQNENLYGAQPPSAAREAASQSKENPGSSRMEVSVAPTTTQRNTHRNTATIPSASTPSSFASDNASAPTATHSFTLNWNQLLLMVWITGAAFLAGRFLLGKLRLFKLIRKAAPLGDPAWRTHIQQVAASLGIRRQVDLLESHDTDVPLAAGAVRPKVVLSADYAEWSPLRRNAVLQHELAHIKRLDALTQLIARLACAMYWFHPLVWISVRAMKAECERACDDYVLAAGTKPSEYAHELLEIAASLRHPELNAALAMARRSQLEGRVLALLNPAVVRGSVSRKMILAAAVLTICIVLPLAAIQAAGPQKESTPATAEPAVAASAPSQTALHAPAPSSPAAPDPAVAPAAPAQPAMVWSEPATAPARAPSAPAVAALPAPAARLAGESAPAIPAPPAPAFAPQNAPAVAAPPQPSMPPAPLAPVTQRYVGSSGIEGCNGNGKHSSHVDLEDNDGHKKWIASWSGDDCQVDLRAEGEIRFNAEATNLESISSGGYFEVNERHGAELRHVQVTPSGNGLQYEYKVNGTQQQFDQNAREWFSRFLLSLERTTGFAADSRVPMLLKKGGPQAVLDEISNLQTDYVRGLYFRKLLDQPDLPAPIVNRIITQAGEQIKTDYEMARVLMEVAQKYPMKDEASRTAFLTAANHLKTDYEHSRVLITLLKMPNLSKENIRMALGSAATIKTDYEKSRILVTLAEMKSFDESEISTYLKLVPEIHTDYEKSRSLIALMQSHNISNASVSKILEAASTIHTDYEKSRILMTLAGMSQFDENQIGSYLNVVDSIGADYERSRSLMAVMDKNKLSPAAVTRILDTTSHIHADYEKSRVLLTVANKYSLDGALREKYISAANSIGSEYERNRALAAVVKRASM